MAQMAPAVDIELQAGQFSMHDVNLIHGSNANTSPRRRAGVAFRYVRRKRGEGVETEGTGGAGGGYRVQGETLSPLPGRDAGGTLTASCGRVSGQWRVECEGWILRVCCTVVVEVPKQFRLRNY